MQTTLDARTVLIAVGAAVVTSLSTLVGVWLTQRSLRKSQQAALQAEVEREREKMEHERQMVEQQRLHDQEAHRREERTQSYARLLALADASILGVYDSGEKILSHARDLQAASYRVLLLAPEITAKAGDALSRWALAVLKHGAKKETAQQASGIEHMKRAREIFIYQARRDLKSEGDILPSLLGKTEDLQEPTRAPSHLGTDDQADRLGI
jgi:hypothetical protein